MAADYEHSKQILEEKFRPNTLAACKRCKLLKNVTKTSTTSSCQNCGESRFTKNYHGMACVNLPQESWVAAYMKVKHLVPGMYALSLGQTEQEEVQEVDEYEADDYVDDDDEY